MRAISYRPIHNGRPMNPSSTTVRTVSMAPIGTRRVGAPQRHIAAGASEPRRSIFDAGRTAAVGPGYLIPNPATGGTTMMMTPSITKRNGVDSIVTGGNSKRQKLDIGGNSAAELAALRGTQLGRTPVRPVFNDSEPRINGAFGRTNEGVPVMPNMPAFRNPLPMGVDYSRTTGSENIIFRGLRQPLPSVTNMTPAFGGSRGLSGTSTTSQFMQVPSAVAPAGGSGPNPVDLFNQAAGDIEKKTKSGSPNARITYTHTLNEIAAAYAGVTQEKTLWIIPIVFEEGGSGYNANRGDLFHFGVDVEHSGYNLAIANYMLAISQVYPNSHAEVITPQHVLTNFRFGGVVASEEGPTKSQYVDKQDAHIHRNIVFTVQGEANVYNYWGDVKYGQRIGLILKGVALKNIFAHHYLDVGSYNIDAADPTSIRAINQQALSNVPLQFVPWYDDEGMMSRPDPSQLEYLDDYGIVRMGIFIPIGTVLQVFGEVANQAYISRSWTSAAATYKSGMLRILVNTFEQ